MKGYQRSFCWLCGVRASGDFLDRCISFNIGFDASHSHFYHWRMRSLPLNFEDPKFGVIGLVQATIQNLEESIGSFPPKKIILHPKYLGFREKRTLKPIRWINLKDHEWRKDGLITGWDLTSVRSFRKMMLKHVATLISAALLSPSVGSNASTMIPTQNPTAKRG